MTWEHHGGHFWLVLGTAVVNVVLGVLVSEAARRHRDARLFLVSMAFLSSAGFLGLHALTTPGVLMEGPNLTFALATPVGLLLAAVFAAASSIELSPAGATRVLAWQRPLRIGLAALLAAGAALSLAETGPLAVAVPPEEIHPALVWMAVAGGALYLLAAVRYFLVHRRRPSVVLLSVMTAFVLLAEAMVSVAYGRNWQLSWWEWHVLMATAFGFVGYSAHVRYRAEGSAAGVFDSIALGATMRAMQEEYAQALDEMVAAMRRRADEGAEEPFGPVAARLGERFGLTERQLDVLERSADALRHEREQGERLGALVAVGQEATVIRAEEDLLARVMGRVGDAFRPYRLSLALVEAGELRFVAGGEGRASDPSASTAALSSLEPAVASDARTIALPLAVKGRPAGVLEATREAGVVQDRDRAMLMSFASQLSIALENARLYRQIEGLFRSYMSPDVATALLADPAQAGLGGSVVEVTVLMADLRGFTAFSERSSPQQVVELLNAYFGKVAPRILAEGGTVTQFIGDAVMAVFNAPSRQPDHALRAVRAGLAIHEAIAPLREADPSKPLFRVGINTGPAVVGNVGSAEVKTFTAIGDTVNLAARLEGVAEPGTVAIGAATHALVAGDVETVPVGRVAVKGKADPVEVHRVVALHRR